MSCGRIREEGGLPFNLALRQAPRHARPWRCLAMCVLEARASRNPITHATPLHPRGRPWFAHAGSISYQRQQRILHFDNRQWTHSVAGMTLFEQIVSTNTVGPGPRCRSSA